jgi:hypothetical protein
MIKKKLKNNNNSYVSHLYYNRCQIKLDSIETVFLNGKLKENKINFIESEIPLIENILLDFLSKTDVRYFKENHVNEVARNIIETQKKSLRESAPGRNLKSVFKRGYGNIQKDDVLNRSNKEIVSIDNTIDVNTGRHVLFIELENNKTITKTFESEAELNLYIQRL